LSIPQNIKKFINKKDLDVSKRGGNPRFIDQKCAPDIVSFIADCIANVNLQAFDIKGYLAERLFF
jgi:hypothetical protein